ncbi:hypothetical protein A0H81_04051 [Grifola frondosa]|uniref:Uncharacterized protein n=1 Tax=Grifola frondosa TaxID=5627 RepID=A0A1C7MGJ6_GRIFR|nr:hypothetical protein A0H81_04051 [Grifola frondosa]
MPRCTVRAMSSRYAMALQSLIQPTFAIASMSSRISEYWNLCRYFAPPAVTCPDAQQPVYQHQSPGPTMLSQLFISIYCSRLSFDRSISTATQAPRTVPNVSQAYSACDALYQLVISMTSGLHRAVMYLHYIANRTPRYSPRSQF